MGRLNGGTALNLIESVSRSSSREVDYTEPFSCASGGLWVEEEEELNSLQKFLITFARNVLHSPKCIKNYIQNIESATNKFLSHSDINDFCALNFGCFHRNLD
jgi:hypothetical protein